MIARRLFVVGLAAILAVSGSVATASELDPYRVVPWSAALSASADGDATQRVSVPGSAWLRLVFGRVSLGEGSVVLIRSLRDGGEQRLDADGIARWSGSTALFNGDEVEIELVRGDGDGDATLNVKAVIAGQPRLSPQSICGANDDRTPASDNRVGRIRPGGCTAWRIANGALLTAGHCVDYDPDQNGPMLPDGVTDMIATDVVEFNVPDSQADGTLVASAPQDQFPINVNGIQWRYDGEGQGLGKDWGVFGVNANGNGQLPHQRYGGAPFRITNSQPAQNATFRITGFGTDDAERNQTNQTHTGPFTGEGVSGADIWFSHSVDTQGGNSGSPLYWEAIGAAFGIHTNGGCTAEGGSNFGTSFDVLALQNAINGFPGPNTLHVDLFHPTPGSGSLMTPRNNLATAISQVVAGGILSVFSATYSVPNGTTITKAMTIQAPIGTVSIVGQ